PEAEPRPEALAHAPDDHERRSQPFVDRPHVHLLDRRVLSARGRARERAGDQDGGESPHGARFIALGSHREPERSQRRSTARTRPTVSLFGSKTTSTSPRSSWRRTSATFVSSSTSWKPYSVPSSVTKSSMTPRSAVSLSRSQGTTTPASVTVSPARGGRRALRRSPRRSRRARVRGGAFRRARRCRCRVRAAPSSLPLRR